MYTRRQFFRAFATAAIVIHSPFAILADVTRTDRRLKVIVIGAGLAGLCAAYELERCGHEVVVLEAHPRRVGGRVYRHRFGESLYGELGAMRIPRSTLFLGITPSDSGSRSADSCNPGTHPGYDSSTNSAERNQKLSDLWSASCVLNMVLAATS